MFLNKLNDSCKLSFLSIATALVNSDGFLSEEEQTLLGVYIQELGIDECCTLSTVVDVDKEIAQISTLTSLGEKRLILLELIALANADAKFVAEEEKLLNKVVYAFGVQKEEYEQCIGLVDSYMTAYSALVNFVDGGL